MPCAYMARLVQEAITGFEDKIVYTKVITRTLDGANRHKELIRQNQGLLPVPSIIINGRLAFKTIPGKEDLVAVLHTLMDKQT